MSREYERDFDDEVYEDDYYDENYEDEELVDEDDVFDEDDERDSSKTSKKDDLDDSEDEEDDDELEDSDAKAVAAGKKRAVHLSFACDDCDYRWDDVIFKRKTGRLEEEDDETMDIVCPMCGSQNISQI